MSEDKIYSARDAAKAVLMKAQEILKKHDLAKAEKMSKAVPPSAPKEQVIPNNQEVQITPAPQANPNEQKEGNNAGWGTAPGTKGTLKLAKFLGHVDEKRKTKAKVQTTQISTQAPVEQSAVKKGCC